MNRYHPVYGSRRLGRSFWFPCLPMRNGKLGLPFETKLDTRVPISKSRLTSHNFVLVFCNTVSHNNAEIITKNYKPDKYSEKITTYFFLVINVVLHITLSHLCSVTIVTTLLYAASSLQTRECDQMRIRVSIGNPVTIAIGEYSCAARSFFPLRIFLLFVSRESLFRIYLREIPLDEVRDVGQRTRCTAF